MMHVCNWSRCNHKGTTHPPTPTSLTRTHLHGLNLPLGLVQARFAVWSAATLEARRSHALGVEVPVHLAHLGVANLARARAVRAKVLQVLAHVLANHQHGALRALLLHQFALGGTENQVAFASHLLRRFFSRLALLPFPDL